MKTKPTAFRKPLSWIVMVTAVLLGTQVLEGRPAAAQTAQDLQQSNQTINDFFSGGNQSGGGSLMNLLNQMQLLNGRTAGEFATEQNENLNSEFDKFRRQQQQQLRAPGTVPTTPAAPTAPRTAPLQ